MCSSLSKISSRRYKAAFSVLLKIVLPTKTRQKCGVALENGGSSKDELENVLRLC